MAIACDICGAEVTKEQLLERVADYADIEVCPVCDAKLKKEFEANSLKHLAVQQAEKKAIIERFMKERNV